MNIPHPLTGLADVIERTRKLAALGDCPDHAGNPAVTCGQCRADQLATGDRAGLRDGGVVRAMAACDALFPARYRDARPDHSTIVDWVARVAASPDGAPSLLIVGPVARGKTWQAFGALRAVAYLRPDTAWSASTFADFTASLRPRPGVDGEAVMDRYRSVGVLLLDDLGAAKGSEWVEEITYRLVNHRYDQMRPTIYVSNLGPNELRPVVGDRISSRLAETCTLVALEGPDRRRPGLRVA